MFHDFKRIIAKPNDIVQLVDEDNQLIGSATTLQMRKQNLIYRSTLCFVLNGSKHFYVQKIVETKETNPEAWDPLHGHRFVRGDWYPHGDCIILERCEGNGREDWDLWRLTLNFYWRFDMKGNTVNCWGLAFYGVQWRSEDLVRRSWRSLNDERLGNTIKDWQWIKVLSW